MATEMATGLFVTELEKRRLKSGESQVEFGARWGITGAQWSRLVSGQRRVTGRFARKVISEWPEFRRLWLADLFSDSDAA